MRRMPYAPIFNGSRVGLGQEREIFYFNIDENTTYRVHKNSKPRWDALRLKRIGWPPIRLTTKLVSGSASLLWSGGRAKVVDTQDYYQSIAAIDIGASLRLVRSLQNWQKY